jgi:hypothetical protein
MLATTPEKTTSLRVDQSACSQAMRRLDDQDAEMRSNSTVKYLSPVKTNPLRLGKRVCHEAMRQQDDQDAQTRNKRAHLRPRHLLPLSLFN